MLLYANLVAKICEDKIFLYFFLNFQDKNTNKIKPDNHISFPKLLFLRKAKKAKASQRFGDNEKKFSINKQLMNVFLKKP